jgi:Acetyltransferase (GNAT) domain
VSEDSATASSLVEQATQNTQGGWSWDLLANNREAVTVARDLGFTAQRHLVRMARGKTLQGKDNAMYAIAGFELG